MEVCAPPNSGAPENRLIATFDFRHVRETSLVQAERLGYPTNPSLPLMEGDLMLRNAPDVAKRMLCLSATVAAACGFPRDEAIEWLERENLGPDLSESEVAFLRGTGDAAEMQNRVEGLWALAWAAGLVNKLDFGRPCEDSLVTLVTQSQAVYYTHL